MKTQCTTGRILRRYRTWTACIAGLGLAALPAGAAAQVNDVTGVVSDSLNNETLPNALVELVGAPFRTLTDPFGRFTLVNVPDGDYVMRVSHLGYRITELPLSGAGEGPITVRLTPDAISLEGVTVETSTDIVQVPERVSQVTISPRKLGTLPSLGETDVFRALQLLPGVSGTNDATSGLFVRGGTPDENLVLLDGMTVYHVDHFFGVFSAFNSDAIKDVQLFKGGFPAMYGGRTSSVVDMIGKTGDNQRFRASGGMNLLSARAVTEVPIGGSGSWLVSARRSYTDVIRTPLYGSIFGTLEGAEDEGAQTPGPGGGGFGGRGGFQQTAVQPSFYFYDLNSKLTYATNTGDVLTASFYSGADDLDESSLGQQVSGPDGQTRTTPDRVDQSRWGNLGVSAGWSRQWGSRLSTNLLAAYSEYFSDGSLDVSATQFARGFDENNNVSDFTLRLDNSWRPFQSSDLGFGLHMTRNDVDYTYDQLQGDSIRGSLELEGSGRLLAGYVQHLWAPSDRIDVSLGVRATTYDQTDEVYWAPRASARVGLTDNLSAKGAWGHHYQFVKRVENEDVLEGSRDFWVLAGDEIEPRFAEHRIAGLSYQTTDWLFDVEAFDKDLEGISEFSTRARTSPDEELFELFFTGTGKARGVEVLAQRTRGALTGWVSYTLSEVEYTLDGFNDDAPFPASHDQRHELKTVLSYQAGPWVLSGTWAYGSGRPYTLPESQYAVTLLDGRTTTYIEVGEKNGQRLPAYHRMDLSASRRFETERTFYELNFSLFNAYGRNNVWYRQFELSELPMVVTDVTTLGFTPSIGFRIGLR